MSMKMWALGMLAVYSAGLGIAITKIYDQVMVMNFANTSALAVVIIGIIVFFVIALKLEN